MVDKIINTVFVLLYIIAWAYALFLAAIAIFISLFFFSAVPLHNFNLWRMDRTLDRSILHPVDSEVVKRYDFLGIRSGYEQCTYEVGEVRSTSLPVEKLSQWYENLHIGLFGFDNHMLVRIIVLESGLKTDSEDPAYGWAHSFMGSDLANRLEKTYYLVYLYKPDYSWFGDYRCMD